VNDEGAQPSTQSTQTKAGFGWPFVFTIERGFMMSLEEVEILKGVGFALAMLATARTINKDAVYTIGEAARLVQCNEQSIRRAIATKHLKAGGIGRAPRVKGADLLAWIEAGGRTGRRGKAPR
jgi:excisionase family DNA binding protein